MVELPESDAKVTFPAASRDRQRPGHTESNALKTPRTVDPPPSPRTEDRVGSEEPVADPGQDGKLSAARGIVLGVAFGILIWAGIGFGLWYNLAG
jgi:hypothetical protein